MVKAKRGSPTGSSFGKIADSSSSRADLVFKFLSFFHPFHWPSGVVKETLPSSQNRALRDLVCRGVDE
jgi:hypothetical protein